MDFDSAAILAKEKSSALDTATQLQLYGLYKCAKDGKCTKPPPPLSDFTQRAKHDAWAATSHLSPSEASECYVSLVTTIIDSLPATDELVSPVSAHSDYSGITVSKFAALSEEMYALFKSTFTLRIAEEEQSLFDIVVQGDTARLKERLYLNDQLIDSVDEQGMSLLHWAVDRENIKMCDFLIQAGIDINLQDQNGNSCLHQAVYVDSINFASFLLDAGIQSQLVNNNGQKAQDMLDSSLTNYARWMKLAFKVDK